MADPRSTLEAVWRIESAKLIATLVRMVGDVGEAEDLAQDAFVAALEKWPETGVPDNPGAWLTAAAKNRAIDVLRRRTRLERKKDAIGVEAKFGAELNERDIDADLDDDIGDELLRLVFMSCHPVLTKDARVALTLRLLGGLTTEEIARAFLAPVATIQQRIVRAKKTLTEAKVPFEVPRGEELEQRLGSVMEVIYLIFNEGYSATAGDDWMRPQLCEDALRLGRIVAELVRAEPEVHGLVALMEIQASRMHARVDKKGEPILLLDQDRSKWDYLLIDRGLGALYRAEKLGKSPGTYTLQASIAACHARARNADDTDWKRIAELYDTLAKIKPSGVVELNRSVAYTMAFGAEAGLAIVDKLVQEPSLKHYHLLPTVRGDFLFRLGRFAEAKKEFQRAAALTRNARERELMIARAAACDSQTTKAAE